MDLALPTMLRPRRAAAPARARLVAGGLVTVGLTATAAALGAGAQTDHPALTALLRAAMVAAPLIAALYARSLRPYARFGRLLWAVGLTTFVTTLAELRDPVPYTAGRIAGWGLEALLVVLLLSFPGGRPVAAADRRLTAAMAVVLAVFFLPTLLLSEHFRVPSPYTSCTAGCPRSALFAAAPDGPATGHALWVAGSLLVFVLMLAVVTRLQQRIADAHAVERLVLVPVLAVGMARTALVGCGIVGRDLGGTLGLAQASTVLIAAATPLVAVAFLAGIVRSRLFAERALRDLATCLPDVRRRAALDRHLARVLHDDTVRIDVPRPGAVGEWVDGHGERVAPPGTEADRCAALVHDRRGRVVAAITGHAALRAQPELLDAAGGLVAVALENLRLDAEREVAAQEVRRSRARLARAADDERRRIGRDLHDGAQQRLIALRIELGLAEELVGRDPDAGRARVGELEELVTETLDELRALAHGICPPLLADLGLAEALRDAARRSPAPATVVARHVGRYPPDVESAVYFCVLEALQNVAKHAHGAERVTVSLDDGADGELAFAVADDGCGDPEAIDRGGAGLTNMRDRIEAVGGRLSVSAQRGAGTQVRGRVPVERRS